MGIFRRLLEWERRKEAQSKRKKFEVFNPARLIKYRDKEKYHQLIKSDALFVKIYR